jgi:hypothetical protein
MPVSKFYNPLSKPKGEVSVPSPNDPVQLSRQGNTSIMNFGGAEPARVGGGDLMQGLRDLFLGKEDLPEAPESAGAAMGYEPLEMPYGQDYQIPSFESAKPKPTGTYGTNRGGTGSAGRKSSTPQFGGSQFDVGGGYEPLEMNDKPWELDQNTAEDVAPGTSLTPQTESEASEKLDLDTPQGMYKALSQRYPDILSRNLDELEGARVTAADTDALRERGNLGSLFIAASKAASGAGSVRGKTAESIAEKIVSREDTLARQQLKDRLDVARENMALNAKAVDLATQQINFADEREQYDPNSDVSQFARDFMEQEFGVKVPSNVPAYQLKQFLPAILGKYQAQERAKYQSAALGQRNIEAQLDDAYRQLKLAQDANDKEAERNLRAAIARLNREAKVKQQTEKPVKMLGGVSADVAKVEMDLANKYRADKTVLAYDLMKNELAQLRTLANEGTPQSDQALITKFAKILDPGSVVRETEFAITERGGGLIDSIRNTLSKAAGTGRLQPGQRQNLIQTAEALFRGIQETYQAKRQQYIQQGNLYGARPEAVVGIEQPATQSAPASSDTLPSGKKRLTPKERQELEDYNRRISGGQ